MNKQVTLVIGDSVVMGVITIIGFVSHGELATASLPRMMTTFLPLLASWFLIAPWLGLFDMQKPRFSYIWRIPLAMLFAAPLTTVLRAAVLNSSALPLFTLILGGSSTIGMLVWRTLWGWMKQA
jgi:hypothetical protein